MSLSFLSVLPEIETALVEGRSVLALESTILTHGMPYPQNLEFARQAESVAREEGVVPATIAVIEGVVRVGLGSQALQKLVSEKTVLKLAAHDLGPAVSQGLTGGTTVSATLCIAHRVGLSVFATGGIGGVHRSVSPARDISQDLKEMGRSSLVVVSSGPKAFLDLPQTLEALESEGVTVVGYKTRELPAFYSRQSGIMLSSQMNSPEEISRAYHVMQSLGLKSSLMVANPIPKEFEIPYQKIKEPIRSALEECRMKNITGKEVSPFILQRLLKLTGGASLRANTKLALNNVRLGAKISKALCGMEKT